MIHISLRTAWPLLLAPCLTFGLKCFEEVPEGQSPNVDLDPVLLGITCSHKPTCSGWDPSNPSVTNESLNLEEFLMGDTFVKEKVMVGVDRFIKASPTIRERFKAQALENGFDKEVTLVNDRGKNVRKFFKVMTDSVNARVTATRCLENGGILPRAYSADQLPGLMSALGLTGTIPIGLFKYLRFYETERTEVIYVDSAGKTVGFASDSNLLEPFSGCEASFTDASYGGDNTYAIYHGKSN